MIMPEISLYNAAAYVRLSKEDVQGVNGKKAESNSISNQKQLIMDFVKSKPDINLVSIREDDGYTGTDYDRPDFQRMMDDIRAGKINCVIVKDLSRFGREYINAGKYIDRLFPYYGVRLIAINDNIDTVTRSSSDDFSILLKNLINDNYCRDISIKIRSQLQVKRKNGEFLGAFAPYGYVKSETERNKLVIDPYAAEVVRDIFRWKLDGMNNGAIAHRLNELGILSPMEYKRNNGLQYKTPFKTKSKAMWSPMTVRRILSNPEYVGTLVQGVRTRPNYKIKKVITNDEDKWVIVENAHEPIIDPETYLLIVRLLELDTRTSPHEDRVFPLAGLLYCEDCKGAMVRKSVKRQSYTDIYYVCSTHKAMHNCSPHMICSEDLETAVLATLQNHIQTVMEMEGILAVIKQAPTRKISIQKAQNRLVSIDTEVDRFRRLKIGAYEDFKEGLLSEQDYEDIHSQYVQRIEQALYSREQVERELNFYLQNEAAPTQWIQDFLVHKNITVLTRSVAVKCIQRIEISKDKRIEVQFSHQQDYEALLEEIESHRFASKEVS